MATRLSWWTIPATVVVLVRVVTLDPKPDAAIAEPAGEPAPAVAAADPPPAPGADMVVLRDAAGSRLGPLPLSFDDALVLRVPAALARQRVDFTLRRHLPHAEQPSLWLRGAPLVRDDATIPILGLPAGRYTVELSWRERGEDRRLGCDEVVAPGTVDLRQ